ncbi:3-phosphoserine/phosphohydroxythreonine transaminase [Paenibacillus hexagrammi]|uniref:3-phosphoserine/phosphohydroxythreonine transaminase n=1 Tax=Paenibacillus hexagrammi TaxID=2908839 RepID=UPI0038621A7C
MTTRLYNFNPGPAALPLEVLEEAKEQFVYYGGKGISLLEMSHRSRDVEQLNEETQQLLLRALDLEGGNYHVLFMGGGASTQFALLPLNFLKPNETAAYALTGSFAEKAYKEASFIGRTHIITSSRDNGWRHVPDLTESDLPSSPAYVHITTNNTIEGSCYKRIPDLGSSALVGDMTSDLLSRKLDLSKFSLLYAGAQKNLGPAGVTAVIVRDDFLKQASNDIPTIFRYTTFAQNKSLYNTPPVHSIYMMNLVLKWFIRQGGITKLEQLNQQKAELLYRVIDESGGFYKGIIDPPYRSHMNITWTMRNEAAEKNFIRESMEHGFEGLAGHLQRRWT